MADKVYECPDCGQQVVVAEESASPDCCGKPMRQIPLENCAKAPAAEHARLRDEDDACDDFVR
jgi:endogenous inhibitor of DNA gyrase (YacG/DUF329 family)